MSQEQVLLMHGVRSGLEDEVCKDLAARGVEYEYEALKLKYVKPATHHTYTPDIVLKNGIVIETKGRFTKEDREKMLLVKKSNPDLDIRIVFSNSKNKLYKGSKTTYGDWCKKNGIPFADKRIPDDWLTS